MSTAQKSLIGSNDQFPILAAMEAAMKENGGGLKTNTNGDVLSPSEAILNPNGSLLNPIGAVSDLRDPPVLSTMNTNPGNSYISPYEGTGFLSSTGSSILESVSEGHAPVKAQYRGAASETAQGSYMIPVG